MNKTDGNASEKPGKNHGELSELYVFLSALNEGRIYEADENLDRIDDLFYTINRILGGSNAEGLSYVICDEGQRVEIRKGQELVGAINKQQIIEETLYIGDALGKPAESGVIDLELDAVKHLFHMDGVNVNSRSKVDMTLELYDYHIGTTQVLPFSIKSFVGGEPTLINSSKLTNFTYRIQGNLTDSDVEEINSMIVMKNGKPKADIFGRTRAILDKGCELVFESTSPEYDGNLRAIDSALPEIIGEMLLQRFKSGTSKISELVDILSEENPIGYVGPQEFYRIKISRLLMDSFMGMVPSKVWDGRASVHGGYIVVKPDKEIVCYHLSNRDKFEDYLYGRAHLDSYGVSRSKYASIEKDDVGLIYRLNLSVRLSN